MKLAARKHSGASLRKRSVNCNICSKTHAIDSEQAQRASHPWLLPTHKDQICACQQPIKIQLTALESRQAYQTQKQAISAALTVLLESVMGVMERAAIVEIITPRPARPYVQTLGLEVLQATRKPPHSKSMRIQYDSRPTIMAVVTGRPGRI